MLRTPKPLYARDLLADKQRRMPLLPALKSYLSLKSPALRNAGRLSVDVKRCQPDGHCAASAEVVLDPDDSIAGDAKNGYGATRLRIVNRLQEPWSG